MLRTWLGCTGSGSEFLLPPLPGSDQLSADRADIKERHQMLGHVHMLLSISPKYTVSQVVGFQG
jgi:hypothetical protein